MKNRSEGFFKKEDCIEVSGKIVGIVSQSDSLAFALNRLIKSNGKWYLCPDHNVYSNEAKHYVEKYWIKKVPAPDEYEVMETVPFRG